MKALVAKLLIIPLFFALTGCATVNKKPTKKKKRAKHKTSQVVKTKPEPAAPTPLPERYQDIVNLEWMEKYDMMLKANGHRLNPPRHPGDRNGVTVEGANSRVSPKVLEDYETLKKLEN
jgi:hypothetical protein